MQDLSDEQLVRLAVASNLAESDAALEELFTRYQKRVALWCLRVSGDRDWAADLAQEVFLRAWRNLHSFRADAKFSTWLYTIARNHCFNAVQSRNLRPEEPLEEFAVGGASAGFDVQLESEQQRRHLQALVAETLDETEARVMTLHYGEELTLSAITSLLNLSNASGAKAYVVSARRKLQAAMSRWNAREVRRGSTGQ